MKITWLKIPIATEGGRPVGYLQSVQDVNSGPPKTSSSSGREEDLNPGPPAYKSSALTTRPRSPPLLSRVVKMQPHPAAHPQQLITREYPVETSTPNQEVTAAEISSICTDPSFAPLIIKLSFRHPVGTAYAVMPAQRGLSCRQLLTVEPVIFLYAFGLFMNAPVLQQYIYSRLSEAKGFPYHFKHKTGCEGKELNDSMKRLEKEVPQPHVNILFIRVLV